VQQLTRLQPIIERHAVPLQQPSFFVKTVSH